MKVFILTPEKTIYKGETISLRCDSVDGSFQLLDHHTSMIALLKEVNIQINKDKLSYHLKNVIIEVKNGVAKIFYY